MKKAIGCVFAFAIVLGGCTSKTDPNKKNFSAALDQYFAKRGELCLGQASWPVEITALEARLDKDLRNGLTGRMVALESVGLVKSTESEKPSFDHSGKPTGDTYKVTSYSLTETSKPFQREVKDSVGLNLSGKPILPRTDLCWGRKQLAEVVKWEGPMKLGDNQVATVHYRYKLDSVAEWANRPEVITAFPAIAREMVGAEGHLSEYGVVLTSEGWEAKGLDSDL